jgi:hypothetical protein
VASNPSWVGENKHATVTALVVDAYGNGVPDRPVTWALLSGTGVLSPLDSLSNSSGAARADFLSPRTAETDQIRATSGSLNGDLDLKVDVISPTAGGGYVTNYPNPFHAGTEGTTIAYKLDDVATVTLRVFTNSGTLVRREVFERGAPGGNAGVNGWVWDGRNGKGEVVASGGYIVFIEAQGQGQTVNVIRRKVAVVR